MAKVIICNCGCERVIEPKPWHKYSPPKFLHGHGAHLALRKNHPNKVIPKPNEIPSGSCECGCGGKTNLAKSTSKKQRHFKGYPMPFMRGHRTGHKGEQSPHWKGGRIEQRGYILILKPEHPKSDSKGYIREHRLIAEEMLGRPLKSCEDVHHINGIKSDNRPENLVVLTKGSHNKLHPEKVEKMHKALTTSARREAGKLGAKIRWNTH